jgi:hypothetical protein
MAVRHSLESTQVRFAHHLLAFVGSKPTIYYSGI